MQTTIEIPQIEDFYGVNELAKQVHELHVNWRPDLFLSVDEVISKEDLKQKELSINYKKAGDKFELGEAKCEIKSIDNSEPTSSSKINSTSIVIQMEANNNKYLFMGDAEDDVETNSKITWEDIDVLKVGHHGSDTSSTEQFINKVLPEMAVISVNSNTNSYGHPSEKVIKRLQDKKCEIYRTDMNGTILLINEDGTNKVQMLDTKVNAGK